MTRVMASPLSMHAPKLPTARNIGRYPLLPKNDARAMSRVKAALTNTESVPGGLSTAAEFAVKYLPATAKILGKPGSTGTTYEVTMTEKTRAAIYKLGSGNRISTGTRIRDGTRLAVKIVPVPGYLRKYWDPSQNKSQFEKNKSPSVLARFYARSPAHREAAVKACVTHRRRQAWMHFLQTAMREAVIHQFLMTRSPIRIQCTPRKVSFVHPKDVAQEFYFAGSDAGVFVYVSRMIHGTTPRTISPKTASSIERAVLVLHAFGVAHGDAHLNNIIVDGDGCAKFIDFGMSVILPDDVRRRALEVVQRASVVSGEWPVDLETAAHKALHGKNSANRYLNSALQHRGFHKFFNPNGKLVRHSRFLAGNGRGNVWKVC